MLGVDTRAMSKANMGYQAVDAAGSHQNGKHLLGSIPGCDYNKLFDLEEEAMWLDALTEEKKKAIPKYDFKEDHENITREDEFSMTPLQGKGIGATTSPEQAGLVQGFSAGSGEAVTKKFVISDEEAMVEELRRLDMEVKQYDILL